MEIPFPFSLFPSTLPSITGIIRIAYGEWQEYRLFADNFLLNIESRGDLGSEAVSCLSFVPLFNLCRFALPLYGQHFGTV